MSSDDCKEALVKYFENTKVSDWKRKSKRTIDDQVVRHFVNDTAGIEALVYGNGINIFEVGPMVFGICVDEEGVAFMPVPKRYYEENDCLISDHFWDVLQSHYGLSLDGLDEVCEAMLMLAPSHTVGQVKKEWLAAGFEYIEDMLGNGPVADDQPGIDPYAETEEAELEGIGANDPFAAEIAKLAGGLGLSKVTFLPEAPVEEEVAPPAEPGTWAYVEANIPPVSREALLIDDDGNQIESIEWHWNAAGGPVPTQWQGMGVQFQILSDKGTAVTNAVKLLFADIEEMYSSLRGGIYIFDHKAAKNIFPDFPRLGPQPMVDMIDNLITKRFTSSIAPKKWADVMANMIDVADLMVSTDEEPQQIDRLTVAYNLMPYMTTVEEIEHGSKFFVGIGHKAHTTAKVADLFADISDIFVETKPSAFQFNVAKAKANYTDFPAAPQEIFNMVIELVTNRIAHAAGPEAYEMIDVHGK